MLSSQETKNKKIHNKEQLQIKVNEIWKEVLKIDKVDDGSDFLSCGGNSLSMMQLFLQLEIFFGDEIPFDILVKDGNIFLKTLVDVIWDLVGGVHCNE